MPKHYSPQDLIPKPGEWQSLEEIERAYQTDRAGAWIPPTTDDSPAAISLAPNLLDSPDRDTFLYRILFRALRELHGYNYTWTPQYQKRGTCVGQGTKLGVDIVMSLAWFLAGMAFTSRAAVAPIYTGSRVEVAKKPGRWDGSNGSWACKWLRDWGVVLLSELELPDDARDQDERLATLWTTRRTGVPDEFETMARVRPIRATPRIETAREAGKLIETGAPIVTCSNQIPSSKRDSRGFAKAHRGGGHCTVYGAVRYDPFGLLYINSWNRWGTGGKFPDDQPEGSVWLDEADANRAIQQHDTHALIGITGLSPLPDNDLYLSPH